MSAVRVPHRELLLGYVDYSQDGKSYRLSLRRARPNRRGKIALLALHNFGRTREQRHLSQCWDLTRLYSNDPLVVLDNLARRVLAGDSGIWQPVAGTHQGVLA